MPMRSALIRIEQGQDGAYPVSLSVTEADGTSAPQPDGGPSQLVLPGDLDLAGARALMLEEDGDSDEFATLGRRLHDVLVETPAGQAWRALRNDGQPLRTLLEVHPEELRTLPWETLRDLDDDNWAFLDHARPLCRIREAARPQQDEEEWWPLLRVMVVVGIGDEEAAPELAGLHEGLAHVCGLVVVDVVRPSDEVELTEAYEELQPHVLHFIGHGHPGELEFRPANGQGSVWSWESESIGTLLKSHRPRLVVLNACRSSEGERPTPEQRRGVLAVADRMSAAGVRAVVAMQGDVRDDAASAFSVELWRRLAGGAAVDVAVARARERMRMAIGSAARRDPWLPVLTVSVPPDRVLPAQYQLPEGREHVLSQTPGGRRIRRFVDRGAQRRLLWNDVVDAGATPAHDGIMVIGRGKLGKTAFAEWCVGACAARGYVAAFVDLSEQVGNSLDILATIAEELCAGEGNDPAVVEPLDRYIARVDELQREATPAPLQEPAEGRYRRRQSPHVSDQEIEQFYVAFRAALAEIGGEHPVLLALDNAPASRDGHWGYFVRFLLAHLSDAKALCVITAPDPETAKAIVGPALAGQFSELVLPPFKQTEFAYALRQFLRAVGYRREDISEFLDTHELPAEPNCFFFTFALSCAAAYDWKKEPVA